MATHNSSSSRILSMEGTRTPFNVVILYEDQDSALSALRAYHLLETEMGGEFLFACELWRMDVLQIHDLKQTILESLGRAQSVLVATKSLFEPNLNIPDWVIGFLKRTGSSVQQAWIHPSSSGVPLFEAIDLSHFETDAAQFPRKATLAAAYPTISHLSHPASPELIRNRASQVSGILQDILSAHHPPAPCSHSRN